MGSGQKPDFKLNKNPADEKPPNQPLNGKKWQYMVWLSDKKWISSIENEILCTK